MISIFTRKIIFSSYSMESQAKIKSILDNNGIRYYVKVVNRRSASPFANGTRSRTGSFGENYTYMYEYIIYIHKKDFELANRCIHNHCD